MKIFIEATLIGKFILLSFFGIYLIISFWLFYPYEPITIKEPMKIMNKDKIVNSGETLLYEMDFVKHMQRPGFITKQLIDGVIITSSPIIGNIKTGHTIKNFPMKIPEFLGSGENVMKWSGTYKVNPIRYITVVAYTEPFYVVSDKDNEAFNLGDNYGN